MRAPARQSGDWDAGGYGAQCSFVWQYGEAVVDLLAPRTGERVLDLGCGTGHLTAVIAARGADVVGVDSSPLMIEHARASHPGIEFRRADARNLRYRARFDAVFSNAVLHWIKPPEAAAASIAAALRPGGRLVAEFGGRGNVGVIVAAADAVVREMGARVEAAFNPWYYPSVGEYAGLLEEHGLEVRYAALFDRPVELGNGESGIHDWLAMFAKTYLAALPPAARSGYFDRVVERLRPTLYDDGVWYADYRRLRVVAVRTT